MPTQRNAQQLAFSWAEGRRVVAAFDGGMISSDAGALLLAKADAALGLGDRLSKCFVDERKPDLIEHAVSTLVGQHVFALALGYEDLNDHGQLRHDPVMGALLGKLSARRQRRCAALAGKSTLSRLEQHRAMGASRYHKIRADGAAIEPAFVTLFLESHREAPTEIVLDLDATDVPLHGHQEARFFHRYYDSYCYLPLYIFCGEHLLLAKLRPANIDGAAGACEDCERVVAQVPEGWPQTRVILHADSGFCREAVTRWCEENGVDYAFGLARNARLVRAIGAELQAAGAEALLTSAPARRFRELRYGPSKAGAAHGAWWPKPSTRATNPPCVSSSPRYRSGRWRHAPCTRTSTAPAVSARTAARNASSTCSLTDSRPRPSAVISYDCGGPRRRMC